MQHNGTSVLDHAETAQVSRTSHLSDDLARLHDTAMHRRAAVAREIGGYQNKLEACNAEFDTLDAIVETLRSPESTPSEIDWARAQAGRLLGSAARGPHRGAVLAGYTDDVLSKPFGGAR